MVLDGFLHLIIPSSADIKLEVFQAINGQKALDILVAQQEKGCPIDAVLTDQKMPVMGGMELAQSVRRNMTLREVPIILVSGEVLYEKDNLCVVDEGSVRLFDHSLLKPFTVD